LQSQRRLDNAVLALAHYVVRQLLKLGLNSERQMMVSGDRRTSVAIEML
jgi:hypothetical protein